MADPWSKNYTASGWEDPLDEELLRLMPLYNAGRPRTDLGVVEAIAERAIGKRVPRHVVVVGTNGKTSTAHYLAELLEVAGVKTGLYTSPHIRFWNERIRIGLQPVESDNFMQALTEVHDIAAQFQDDSGSVRFFDVLTLTAERLFAEAGVQVGVFEAGIGGRLDATRVLQPELTLLTSVGADHEELLGAEPVQRLREKARVAPVGGRFVASALDDSLEGELRVIAGHDHLDLTILDRVEPDAVEPGYAAANLVLARAGATAILGRESPSTSPTDVEGRFQRGVVGGVQFIADVAHNPTAWEAFLGAVPKASYQVVVAISKPRPGAELAAILSAHADLFDTVITTNLTVRPADDPLELAETILMSGLDTTAIEEPHEAFAEALMRCRNTDLPLLVFGSNYVVVDFLAWADKVG
jgi:folylpolyglutamate synthase/dihydropteroate synthase